MEGRATTFVHSPQATENQTLLVSEPPAECRYSNTREEGHSSSKPHLFQQEEQSYAFPT